MRKLTYVVPDKYNTAKLKTYLKNDLHYSTRLINQLKQIDNGLLINGNRIRTIDIIKKGDILEVNMPVSPAEITIEPVNMNLNVLYFDEDILVINKEPGIACHPTHNHQGDTLANGVSSFLISNSKQTAFRAVGRLDKGTSGIVVCALNKYTASVLNANVKKRYCALVSGYVSGNGIIDKPIIRPDPTKTIRDVGISGQNAITEYKTIMNNKDISFIDIKLKTGRTHQIRVHFSSIGHPLIGDSMYGYNGQYSHHMLHCYRAEICHPVTGKLLTFNASLPEDMLNIINKL